MRFSQLLVGVILVLASGKGYGQQGPMPSSLEVPKGNKLILQTRAKGVQIYVCMPVPTDTNRYAWTLAGPQATLYVVSVVSRRIAKHYYNAEKHPTWEGTDGSTVTAVKLQQADAPASDAIPWLLLQATSTSGSGLFGGVTYIQRINTSGGKAPSTGADKRHKGKYRRVKYTASYLFYGRD